MFLQYKITFIRKQWFGNHYITLDLPNFLIAYYTFLEMKKYPNFYIKLKLKGVNY
jgi:hypothetical protein